MVTVALFLTKKLSAEEAVKAFDAVVAVAALPVRLPINPLLAFKEPVTSCALPAFKSNFILASTSLPPAKNPTYCPAVVLPICKCTPVEYK